MASPRGSFSVSFPRSEPAHGPKEAVMAVGWRALLRSPHGEDAVTLASDEGSTAGVAVNVGLEVEITAWKPRRAGTTLYRVRTRNGRKEGWVSAASLQCIPPPTAPKPAVPVTLATKPAPSRKATTPAGRPRKSTRAR